MQGKENATKHFMYFKQGDFKSAKKYFLPYNNFNKSATIIRKIASTQKENP